MMAIGFTMGFSHGQVRATQVVSLLRRGTCSAAQGTWGRKGGPGWEGLWKLGKLSGDMDGDMGVILFMENGLQVDGK